MLGLSLNGATTIPKILIVDDSPVEHMMTGVLLKSLGFEVVGATSGPEGVSLALSFRPHLILLDMIMPEQDGVKTCLQLRSHGYTGRILLCSAIFDNDVVYAVEQYGANGFISKPVRREALTRQLEQLGLLQPA